MTVVLIRQDSYTKGWQGLSSDTKPAGADEIGVNGANSGDTFYEVDTKKNYVFHEGTWYEA